MIFLAHIAMNKVFDRVIHKYLRLPYMLHSYTQQKPKRSNATVVLLHGIGNSSAAWDQVVKKLPDDLRVISIDLLGHGASPSPRWPRYDASVQARSVMHTLLRINYGRPVVMVGHSMGALVAVEFAKRYPPFVKSLVLCSAPFYIEQPAEQRLPNRNRMLKELYTLLRRHPEKFTNSVALAMKLRLLPASFHVDEGNVDIYMAALEASIINQTAIQDVSHLKKPIQLLHGALDPVVIRNNLEYVCAQNPGASLTSVMAGHEITGLYVQAVIDAITKATVSQK